MTRLIRYKPSVAFTDFDISDKRSSAMSSVLLLFAMLEGICGFVLPISNAFSKASFHAEYAFGEIEHKYYYEAFLMVQYTFSIMSLLYLQGLIFYYDYYHNRRIGLGNRILVNACNEIPSDEEYPYLDEESGHRDDAPDSRELTPASSIENTSSQHDEVDAGKNSINSTEDNKQNKRVSSESLPMVLALQNIPQYPSRMPVIESYLDNQLVGKKKATFMVENEQNSTRYTKSAVDSRRNVRGFQKRTDQNEGIFRRKPSQMFFQKIFGDGEQPGSNARTDRNPAFSRDTEGVNLYLRLGAVGFGFGVMIMDGLKIADQFEKDNNSSVKSCHSQLWIPKHLIHFIFVFWQTYFVFKYHKVVFNVQKFVLRFLLSHMAVANLCQWLKTIVDEISEENRHQQLHAHAHSQVKDMVHNLTSSIAPSVISHTGHSESSSLDSYALDHANETCKSIDSGLTIYLSPCAVEYSLITGAIFYKMFQKIGQVQKEFDRMEKSRQQNQMTKGFSECHRSHRGLFVGLLMFMATIVAMALFFIFTDKQKENMTVPLQAMLIYQITEITLLLIGFLTCIVCYYRLRVLKFHDLSEEGAFDGNLLLIGLIGMIFYNMFLIVPAMESIHLARGRQVSRLFATKAVLEIVQALTQVFFILEASRRCARTMEHVRNKPGRTLIVLLLIINLSMWVVNIFEVKRAGEKGIHKDYFGDMVWAIIINISLPLIIFFRFHSTVCLSDIWTHAYKFKNH